MKMIKLLVLRSGKMVKMHSYATVGKVFDERGCTIGCIYSVTKDIYRQRKKKRMKKLFINSITAPVFKIVKQ